MTHQTIFNKEALMNDQSQNADKRKKISLSKEETEILRALFLKAIMPVTGIIVVSLVILFFGLQFLMDKASFGNYGVSPAAVAHSVQRFIAAYFAIAISNIVLMVALSFVVLYLVLHNIVLPIMRITREIKSSNERHSREKLVVRKDDKLFVPLIEAINRISGK
jgi:uncharacterized membrane protein